MSRNKTRSILSPFSQPSLSRSTTLADDDKSTTYYSLQNGTSSRNAVLRASHAVWIEIAPGKHVVHEVKTVEDEKLEYQPGRVPQAWFKRVQRILSTLILAGTFMAGVEAQILCLIFTALPTLEKTMAVCFAVSALFLTSLSALYCAVAYMWLRSEWNCKDEQPHYFDEWVSGSISTMITWCAVSLVIGVYCGFLAIVCFLYAVITHVVAMVCTCVFALSSVGPVLWGYYRYRGLSRSALQWVPTPDGPHLVRKAKLSDGSSPV